MGPPVRPTPPGQSKGAGTWFVPSRDLDEVDSLRHSMAPGYRNRPSSQGPRGARGAGPPGSRRPSAEEPRRAHRRDAGRAEEEPKVAGRSGIPVGEPVVVEDPAPSRAPPVPRPSEDAADAPRLRPAFTVAAPPDLDRRPRHLQRQAQGPDRAGADAVSARR